MKVSTEHVSETLDAIYPKLGGTQLSDGIKNIAARTLEKAPATPPVVALLLAIAASHELIVSSDDVLRLVCKAKPMEMRTLSRLPVIAAQLVAVELGLSREAFIAAFQASEAAAIEDVQAFQKQYDEKVTLSSGIAGNA